MTKIKLGVWCVAVALVTLSVAGAQQEHPATAAAVAKSIYSIQLKDKILYNPTYGEFVEWLNKELRLRGAEDFGFWKVVLAENLDPARETGMGVEIKSMSLLSVLGAMQETSPKMDWYYRFGILTIYSRDTSKTTAITLALDSPLLVGIDFKNPDRNLVITDIWSRFSGLGLRYIGEQVIWSEKPGILHIWMPEPDAEAAYALDQIMRQSNILKIVEPPAGKESDVDTTKPSGESHENESNPEKTQK
jgi:hypothetical protein